jgi:hypothetical protein
MLLAMSLPFCLFILTSTLDAQWYWPSGIIESAWISVFPSWGITASGSTVAFERGKKPPVKSDVVTAVPPQYPVDERTNRHQGAGFFRMIIDPKTGLVTQVLVETSTGFRTLDDNVIHAGLRWRWKPFTWKEFTFSCTFQDYVGYK